MLIIEPVLKTEYMAVMWSTFSTGPFIHSLHNSTHCFTSNTVQKPTANQYQVLTSCLQASVVKSKQIVRVKK